MTTYANRFDSIRESRKSQESITRSRSQFGLRKKTGSLHLDAGGLDHRAPALAFPRQERGEIVGRSDARLDCELGKGRFDLGGFQALVDGGVEPPDDLGRRAGG